MVQHHVRIRTQEIFKSSKSPQTADGVLNLIERDLFGRFLRPEKFTSNLRAYFQSNYHGDDSDSIYNAIAQLAVEFCNSPLYNWIKILGTRGFKLIRPIQPGDSYEKGIYPDEKSAPDYFAIANLYQCRDGIEVTYQIWRREGRDVEEKYIGLFDLAGNRLNADGDEIKYEKNWIVYLNHQVN